MTSRAAEIMQEKLEEWLALKRKPRFKRYVVTKEDLNWETTLQSSWSLLTERLYISWCPAHAYRNSCAALPPTKSTISLSQTNSR